MWVRTEYLEQSTVIHQATTPLSYIVSTPRGQVRRDRINLRPTLGRDPLEGLNRIPETVQELANSVGESRDRVVTQSQSGVVITAPDRLRL